MVALHLALDPLVLRLVLDLIQSARVSSWAFHQALSLFFAVLTLARDPVRFGVLLRAGHEDLRQDKRVMQLFGLVNTLLANDNDTAKKDLRIRGYSVIPLSPNSGLIEVR